MFHGEFRNAMDAKGRVSVPSPFRRVLAERYSETRLVMARWPYDPCIAVWPYEEWLRFQERVERAPASEAKRAFKRFLFSSAVEVEPDRQGRILVPMPQRSYAGLEKEVQLVGAGEMFQIWNAERWAEQLETDLALAKQFALDV
ncbi:MAG: division/cell wall cluster transcriptional repressor MraZ [Zetaproteobacteria bacterium]|nr:MAG: division/cell wall cluster transcriptional repressor MraZ [Zetaproteobacteria bacterium]